MATSDQEQLYNLLAMRAKAGDTEALNRLVKEFTPLVTGIARKSASPKSLPVDDLVEIGLRAIWKSSVPHYKPEKGNFSALVVANATRNMKTSNIDYAETWWNRHVESSITEEGHDRAERHEAVMQVSVKEIANKNKTHCPAGHPYNRRNTGYTTRIKNGKTYKLRYCRECLRLKALAPRNYVKRRAQNQANAAQLSKERAERYAANREEEKAYRKKHYQENAETIKAKRRAAYQKNVQREREKALARYHARKLKDVEIAA